MSDKKKEIPDLYFYTPMPKIHLEYSTKYDLYAPAFYENNNNNCEYCLDTTTWD